MSKKIIDKPRRVARIGQLSSVISIHDRNIVPPISTMTDFTESFNNTLDVWAMIKSTGGKIFFDGVGTDVAISHEIYVRYDPTITTESWIELEDKMLLDIMNVENLDERNEYMKLLCRERGLSTLGASQA